MIYGKLSPVRSEAFTLSWEFIDSVMKVAMIMVRLLAVEWT